MSDPTITTIKGSVPVEGGVADVTLTFNGERSSMACLADATVDLPEGGTYEVSDIQVSGAHLLAALRVPFAEALAGARQQVEG